MIALPVPILEMKMKLVKKPANKAEDEQNGEQNGEEEQQV